MRKTLVALAAVLALSACSDKPTSATFITPTNQLVSSNQWIELTAAQTAARVTNNNLIMMR